MAANWNALMNAPNAGEAFTNAFNQARQRKQQEELMRMQVEDRQEDRSMRREQFEAQREDRGLARQDAERQRVAAAAKTLSPVYEQMSKMPYEQRKAYLQSIAPQLQAHGIPAEMIASYDPTDQALQADIMLSGQIERELMPVAPGTVVLDKRTGQPVYQNPRPPRYIPVQAGGKLVLDPSSVPGAMGEGGALPGSAGDDDEWEYIGGPTQPASGGFPY